jgi:outer membrane murein-binding lipoprotein Lpp
VFVYGIKTDDFLIVDKMQLGVLALQGTKELLEIVSELRSEVNALRSEVNALRSEVNALKQT